MPTCSRCGAEVSTESIWKIGGTLACSRCVDAVHAEATANGQMVSSPKPEAPIADAVRSVEASLLDKELPDMLYFEARREDEKQSPVGYRDVGKRCFMPVWSSEEGAAAFVSAKTEPVEIAEQSKDALLLVLLSNPGCQYVLLDPRADALAKDDYSISEEPPDRILSLHDLAAVSNTLLGTCKDAGIESPEWLIPFCKELYGMHADKKPGELFTYTLKVMFSATHKLRLGHTEELSSEESACVSHMTGCAPDGKSGRLEGYHPCAESMAPSIETCGHIYVLINPMMEGLVKVGKTRREPEARAKELSASTGVPVPFVVVYHAYFSDCTAAEQHVHTLLESQGYRVADNKEFFSAPPKAAIEAVMDAEKRFGFNQAQPENTGNDNPAPPLSDASKQQPAWLGILKDADRCYYGSGEDLQDYAEALRLYEQAAKLGSAEACLRLGIMYAHGEGCSDDEETALFWFKEGARQGVSDCHAEMALIFMGEHDENARKCWTRYFASCTCHNDRAMVGVYGFRYLLKTKLTGCVIAHKEHLVPFRDDILDIAKKYSESAEDDNKLFAATSMGFVRLILWPEDTTDRIRGKVGAWNDAGSDEGFVHNNGREFRLHRSEIIGRNCTPKVGQWAEFTAIPAPFGLLACNVVLLNSPA